MADDDNIPYQVLERPPSLSDRVTNSILSLIANSALKPGDRLPSERDLGVRFGVSRTVVREALRSLAAKGVLDVHSGSRATVASVNVERASEALRLYVQGLKGQVNGVTYEQVNDVREMIETRVARTAAASASEDDIGRLAAVHEEFCANADDPDATPALDVAFHRAIAESVHNPLFLIMLDSIEPILLEIRRRVARVPGRAGRAIEAHGLILQRIRDHDPDGAEKAMVEHLEESRAVWRQLDGGDTAATAAR